MDPEGIWKRAVDETNEEAQKVLILDAFAAYKDMCMRLKEERDTLKRQVIFNENMHRTVKECEKLNKNMTECPVCQAPALHLAYMRIHGMCNECCIKHDESIREKPTLKRRRTSDEDEENDEEDDSDNEDKIDITRLVTVVLTGEDSEMYWMVFEKDVFDTLEVVTKPDELSADTSIKKMNLKDLFENNWTADFCELISAIQDGFHQLNTRIRVDFPRERYPNLTFAKQQEYFHTFANYKDNQELYPILTSARYAGFSWMCDDIVLDLDDMKEACVRTYLRPNFW